MKDPILLGELTLSSTGAPNEALILRKGENQTRKGILVFDEDAASSVLSEYERGGVKLPLDFDHAMASESSRVEDRFAAGWFVPVVRDGELIASDIEWTDRGRKAVESKEWRYLSLFGDIEPLAKGKARLKRLRNVALVNLPATLNTLPLVANEGQPGSPMENEDKTLVELTEKTAALTTALSDVAADLGCEIGQIKGAVKALQLKADKADSLQAELSEIKAKAEADKKTALIAKLSEEGKLPPALHDWAQSQSIESLTAFGEKAPVLAPSTKVESAKPDDSVVALSEEEKTAATLLGLTVEALKNHKASNRAA